MLVSDLDTSAILDRVLKAARQITGARYAALGVLDEQRNELSRFVAVGVDDATVAAIGELPRGRGVLGVLVSDPRPLRVRDVREHPSSFGFPEGHPVIRSFLGVPVMIAGEAWGNLYLGEKGDGEEFTETDEEAVRILAEWASLAVANARLYERSERRREQLEHAVRGLEATRDIAVATGQATGSERVLELIAERGRTLIGARTVLIMLRDGPELVVVAGSGYAEDVSGHRVPIAESTSGHVLERGRSERIADVRARLRIAPAELGVSGAHTALLVPMLYRGASVGVMAAFDRGDEGAPFAATDEQLMETFAASAANAVAIARSVEAGRLRSSLAAADAERRHWARELHDDTLQVLGGLRVLLSTALRRGDQSRYETAIREAVEGIEHGIAGLRGIISDLRPAALDEIGLKPALEALLEHRNEGPLEVRHRLRLPDPDVAERVLDPELETTVYRFVQEALTNIVKHARATTVKVDVSAGEDEVTIAVQDNGVGFDVGAHHDGFGLEGMRERVYLAGGSLEIESGDGGTRVRATLPARYIEKPGTEEPDAGELDTE